MIKMQKEDAVNKLFRLIAISQKIAHVRKNLLENKEERDISRVKK
jgi:hypothetical protein